MRRWKKKLILLLCLAAVGLTGCSTMEDMYCLPKRSQAFSDLQTAIDRAMGSSLQYSAPRSGDNQQSVQLADLDGDGQEEAILFARGSDDQPLKILVFSCRDGHYELMDTVSAPGSSFDQVEYAQMDGKPGMEMVVGRQISDQVVRNLAVYSFDGSVKLHMSTNYTRFLVCDLNADRLTDLFVLHPGQEEMSQGETELYYFRDGKLEKSSVAKLSNPASSVHRLMTGNIHGGIPAVFAASLVPDQDSIVTDIYALVDGRYINVSLSNDSGASMQTLRNRYLYAEDIDEDGVVELPGLLMPDNPTAMEASVSEPHVIRWYAMTVHGVEVDKLYTFHCLEGGWYVELPLEVAVGARVIRGDGAGEPDAYIFYRVDPVTGVSEKLMTIYPFTGSDRAEQALSDNRFVLYRTASVTYAARLEGASAAYGMTRDSLVGSFHMIHTDWKTGVT